MAWPTTPNFGNNYVAANGTTPSILAWGTEGIYTSVIVESIRSVPMITEIPIQNGSGVTVKQILINDGDYVEMEVIDDRNFNFPLTNDTVAVINPQISGSSLSSTETFTVINNNYTLNAKAPGHRSIIAKKYSLI